MAWLVNAFNLKLMKRTEIQSLVKLLGTVNIEWKAYILSPNIQTFNPPQDNLPKNSVISLHRMTHSHITAIEMKIEQFLLH